MFQGNIGRNVNFELLKKVVGAMLKWKFWFCGEIYECEKQWAEITSFFNVTYYGKLSPIDIKKLACKADVGIIPYTHNDIIKRISLPLKAYEYVALGLPVVTTPINSLMNKETLFTIASTAESFILEIKQQAKLRRHKPSINKRLSAAKSHNYENNFRKIVLIIKNINNKQKDYLPCDYIKKIKLHIDVKKTQLHTDYSRLKQKVKSEMPPTIMELISVVFRKLKKLIPIFNNN